MLTSHFLAFFAFLGICACGTADICDDISKEVKKMKNCYKTFCRYRTWHCKKLQADIIKYQKVYEDLCKSDRPMECRNGETVYDECGRHCQCLHGRLVKCCRLRKEFTDMSFRERVRYINTVKTASTQSPYKQRYEKLITLHNVFFGSNIHQVNYFLPWHRWYILQYENLLREIDCQVTVPYWDWSLVGANPFRSDFWSPGPHGFGGDGNPCCVTTGCFQANNWSVANSAGGGCLTRNFNGMAPTSLDVRDLIWENSLSTQFVDFEILLREQFHDVVHCSIGGLMCTTNSAAAPEFFQHHSFVDKIWWDWQKLSNDHKFHEYFMTQQEMMNATSVRSRDFLDLNNQLGGVCAEYVDPENDMYKEVKELTRDQIKKIPRLPLPPLSKTAEHLFQTPKAMIRKAESLRKALLPERSRMLSSKSLRGKGTLCGFKEASVRAVLTHEQIEKISRLPLPSKAAKRLFRTPKASIRRAASLRKALLSVRRLTSKSLCRKGYHSWT